MNKQHFSDDDLRKIKKSIKKKLDTYRYHHSLGVAETARCLAMRYQEDMDRAYAAGLLHDCAKYIPDEDRIGLMKKWGLSWTRVQEQNPALLHAEMGAYLAEKEYGVQDTEILNAIRFHTTGRPAMTLLEAIVYTADYIEPMRDKAPRLKELRSLAFQDLFRCVYEISGDTIRYMDEEKRETALDPMTAQVYEYYKKEAEGVSNDGIR